MSSREDAYLDWFEDKLKGRYDIKVSRVGLEERHDKEVKVLNRMIGIEGGGWRLEADPRHAEILVQENKGHADARGRKQGMGGEGEQ